METDVEAAWLLVLVSVLLVALLLMEVPVAFSLATSGLFGLFVLRGADFTLATAGSEIYRATSHFSLVVIPLFVLMGAFALRARLVTQIFEASERVFQRFPGGQGIATVATCAGFGAVTGSSVATAATIGKMAIDEMQSRGVPGPLAAGIVAAGGTLGSLIPPSVLLVFVAIVGEQSIGQMLIAGIVPGLLSALLYMIVIAFRLRGSRTVKSHEPPGTKLSVLVPFVKVGLIAFVVIGGIYSGAFTPTEAGAIGAVVVFGMLLASNRSDGFALKLRATLGSLREAASLTSMVFAIVVGAGIFGSFLVWIRAPTAVTTWVIELPISPMVLLCVLLLLLIPLGMVLDAFSIAVLAGPLMFPIVLGLGFDGIWFGILMVKMMELGLITPPVGLNIFVAAGSATNVSVEETFRGVLPFAVTDVVTVAVLLLFPGIVTWLPSLVA